MRYKIRNGLVIETVCGTSLLIATLEARKHCPYVMRLNEASAYIWKLLFEGKTLDEMTALAAKDFELSPAEARETLTGFLASLIEQNYLMAEETEEKYQ